MTRDEIRTFITQHVQAWSRHDVAALMEHYADDCEVVSPLFRILRGKAEVEAAFRDLFRIFDALAIHLDDVLIDHASGDRAVYMTTLTVTHLGEVLGFPGTGRRFPVKGVFMVGFKNGRIASERRLYDLTEVMLQIGS